MNLTEKIAHVDWTIVEELRHIARGREGSIQELLRFEYAEFRKALFEQGPNFLELQGDAPAVVLSGI